MGKRGFECARKLDEAIGDRRAYQGKDDEIPDIDHLSNCVQAVEVAWLGLWR